jgi:RES domain-containing protein
MNLSQCAALQRGPLTGTWYRAIQPQFWTTALATHQTRLIPSRFNAGALATPQFDVLYLSENHLVALFEVQALLGSPTHPGGIIPHPLQVWTVLNVDIQLRAIADLTQESQQQLLETTAQELTGDWRGYQQRSPATSVSQPIGVAPTQALGSVLFAVPGLEGFRTLSAKLPYHSNLVIFPQKLEVGSQVVFADPATGQRYVLTP